MLGLLALVCGCSQLPGSENPVDWWHRLEGGVIAEQRPPPPGADQPYPNLATVPARPVPPDRPRMAQISAALAEARANAQFAANETPIAPAQAGPAPTQGTPSAQPPPPPTIASAPPSPRAASQPAPPAPAGGLGSAPPPPPPPGAGASASLAAATARPQPATPSTPAPAASPVGSAVLAPPPGGDAPGSVTPQDQAGAPALPTTPPGPPPIAGAPGPTVPTPLPVAPKPPPAPPAPPHLLGTPLPVAFAPRSAVLPAKAAQALAQLAKKRGTATIEVTGFGETRSSDPLAQSAALGLGLNRAEAMAAALAKGGVPAASIRIAAIAAGRGGVARLIQ